jgi:hypothetical protein
MSLINVCIGLAGTEIATIEAKDIDSGDFGRVTYLLDRMSSQVTKTLLFMSLMVRKKYELYRCNFIVNISSPGQISNQFQKWSSERV